MHLVSLKFVFIAQDKTGQFSFDEVEENEDAFWEKEDPEGEEGDSKAKEGGTGGIYKREQFGGGRRVT